MKTQKMTVILLYLGKKRLLFVNKQARGMKQKMKAMSEFFRKQCMPYSEYESNRSGERESALKIKGALDIATWGQSYKSQDPYFTPA